MTLALLQECKTDSNMPWDQWSWSLPQQPIERFFRRHDNLPVKSPHFECKCPPYEECKIDYKFNEGMIDFLHLRGIIKQDEANKYKEEMQVIQRANDVEKFQDARRRNLARRNFPAEEKNCCCPPRSLMMPTFITAKKYKAFVDSFDKKEAGLTIRL